MADIKKEKETPKKPAEEKTPKPDEKDKQIESLQAQKEHFREKAQKAEEEAQKLKTELENISSTLSEDDLKQMNPDYEMMPDEEKKDFREKMAMKRRLAVLEAKEKMRQDYASISEGFRKKIEEKGGYDAFRDYACSPENAGQKSILNLAKSFLYEEKEEIPPEPVVERPGLEEPGIGKEITPPSGKLEMTAEQAAEMRTNHPKEYAELIKAKKLKIVG